jgi:hypothetical protein
LDWEEIYADWQNDDLKYYWQRQSLDVVGPDNSYPQRSVAFVKTGSPAQKAVSV